jgi:hypothetical protein
MVKPTTLREMYELLQEHYARIECYDAVSHCAGLCLCQRTKAAIDAIKPHIDSGKVLVWKR